jgi:hypothetical protein
MSSLKLFSKESFSRFNILTGITIFSFIFFNFSLGVLSLMLKVGINTNQIWWAAGITVLLNIVYSFYFFPKVFGWLLSIISLTIVVGSFAFSFWTANQFYDLSYDGQAYHQEALVELKAGWNPIYERAPGYSNKGNIWLDAYPKGSWINSYTIYRLTDNIETGKLFNIWALFAGFFMAVGALLKLKFNIFWSTVIGLVATLNPVGLYQISNYYIDGQMYGIMLGFGAVLVLLNGLKKESKLYEKISYVVFLFVMTVLFFNVKLVGFVFGTVFLCAFLVYLYFTKHPKFKLVLISSVVSFIFAAVVLGYSPYVTNTINNQSPLYPAFGKGAYNFKTENLPKNFAKKNNLEVLMYSGFLESSNARGNQDIGNLKTPFTATSAEKDAFASSNTKKGGFGQFFGGAVILTLLIFIIFLFLQIRSKSAYDEAKEEDKPNHQHMQDWRNFGTVSLVTLTLLFSAMLNSASTYARFVPQLYLVLILAIMFAASRKMKILNIFAVIMIILLFVNSGLVLKQHIDYQTKATAKLDKQLNGLKNKHTPEKPLVLNVKNSGLKLRLEKFKIDYKDEKKMTCKNRRTYFITDNESEVCID